MSNKTEIKCHFLKDKTIGMSFLWSYVFPFSSGTATTQPKANAQSYQIELAKKLQDRTIEDKEGEKYKASLVNSIEFIEKELIQCKSDEFARKADILRLGLRKQRFEADLEDLNKK